MRLVNSNLLVGLLYQSGVIYQAPSNLSYLWNFGAYAFVCLFIQIITGIFLAMHYAADHSLAFLSVEHIMRDVNYGWLLRYLHANGASMFFIVVYIHILRGMYFGSFMYPREKLWASGVIILLLMIITAFMGYVLPWGQMSFWGATVITNLCSAIPVIGQDVVVWLWGGYAVGNPTLNRFFSLHFLMPFVIFAFVVIHIIFLREHKSNNPLGITATVDGVFFYPYYIIKDMYGLMCFFLFFSFFLFFAPDFLGHPDNYIMSNAMVTPTHIVPEWYFLSFYAILRSIPDKLMGVVALLFAIVALLLLPYLSEAETRSLSFRPASRVAFFFFVITCLILGWMGGKPIEVPFYATAQWFTIFYFSYLLVLVPLFSSSENKLWYEGGYYESPEDSNAFNFKAKETL